jgi:hypothetical protein
MILDERTEFADATALNTGAPGTFNIGDVIDTRSASIDPNVTKDHEGSDLYLVIQVDTTATGGATTGQFRLVSDDVATPDLVTATVHYTGPAIAVASLVAGYRYCAVRLPSGSYERYIGIQQITGGAAFTAGKVNAFLTSDPALWRAYADNVA